MGYQLMITAPIGTMIMLTVALIFINASSQLSVSLVYVSRGSISKLTLTFDIYIVSNRLVGSSKSVATEMYITALM